MRLPQTLPLAPWRTRVLMVLDVVESVRLMEADEKGFIARWRRFVGEVRGRVLPGHGGRIHKSLGDGLMLEFTDAAGALAAGRALIGLAAGGNGGLAPSSHIQLRIAAHVTGYVADGFDIYGCGVNLTARLLGLPGPGEIYITSALREQLGQQDAARTQEVGTYALRDVARPVQVFRVLD